MNHHPRTRGFTLIELLVALGAVLLIVVGIASIFASVGDTLRTGRSVSTLNSAAAQIERQMRRDFGRITRDGFLVIRNEYANAGNPQETDADGYPVVPLTSDDEAPRARRVDEILFFASGRFQSAREPIHPDLVAAADTARIYYGHGVRYPEGMAGDYDLVTELDAAATPTGAGPGGTFNEPVTELGSSNENRNASEWTLLRHVTLLASPRTTPIPQRGYSIFGLEPDTNNRDNIRLRDSHSQIAGQPAADTIFDALTGLWQDYNLVRPNAGPEIGPPSSDYVLREMDPSGGTDGPRFASGLIDIATTSLEETRAIVLDAINPTTNTIVGVEEDNLVSFFNINGTNPDADPSASLDGSYAPGDAGDIAAMQEWMIDAMPVANPRGPVQDRGRMRHEPAPPAYFEAFDPDAMSAFIADTSPLSLALRRADQTMLTSSNFLPNCTEFIVEWTFGAISTISGREGELVWHGLERPGDDDADGQIEADEFIVYPYPFWAADAGSAAHPVFIEYENDAGPQFHEIQGNTAFDPINRGTPVTGDDPQHVLTQTFGYIDPNYSPSSAGDPDSLPAAWPKAVRVTISLADPSDPAVERTFQWIFDLPADEPLTP